MTLKLNGTNSVAAPAYAGDDADTGLQCGTNELKLVTGGSARATVDSSGNLGVGTESPSRLLTVQSTGNANLCIKSGTSGVSQCMFGDTDSDVAGNIAYRHADNAMVFEVNLSERARILSGGGLAFNGDTAQVNALDDYEEGDWTPTITFGDNNSGMAFSSRDGFYIKIGRQVTCWVQCTLTSKGSSTGTAKLSGLPFDVGSELNNTSIEGGGLMVYAANIQGNIRPPYAFAPENGQNHCEIYGNPDSNEQSTALTSTYFENNTLFRGYFTYFAS